MLSSSQFLGYLLEDLDNRESISVFDIGAATADTVNLFSGLKCRLFFADLLTESFLTQQNELSETELLNHFQTACNIPADTQLDYCFFWDLMNYLSRPAIRAFCEYLKPFVHSGTRCHGLIAFNKKIPLPFNHYGLASKEEYCSKGLGGQQPACYYHSQADLGDCLSHFKIRKSKLLKEGRLELLLDAL